MNNLKKGELVLSPTTTSISAWGDLGAIGVRNDTKVIHPAMVGYVPLAVKLQCKKTPSQPAGSQPTDETTAKPREMKFMLASPLHAGKDPKVRKDCLDNVSPFWAVCRSASSHQSANMSLEHAAFLDCGLAMKTGVYPRIPRGTNFTIHVNVLRNSRKIAKGDVLIFPYDAVLDSWASGSAGPEMLA